MNTMLRILLRDSKEFDVGPPDGDLGVSLDRFLQFAIKGKVTHMFQPTLFFSPLRCAMLPALD